MDCLIYLVVMALAFLGAVAFGVYTNYRWMQRLAERQEPGQER